MLLQAAGGSDEGAGRAEPGHEMGHAAAGLLQDLNPRAVVVGPPVGGVRILVGVEVFLRRSCNQLTDQPDGAVRAFQRIGELNLGAIGGDQLLALPAHVARHDQLHWVALGRAHQRVGDAGVAGGGIDDGLTRAECPTPFPVLDHGQCCAILHRAAGVEPFGFRVNLETREHPLEEPNLEQWRVADEFEKAPGLGAVADHHVPGQSLGTGFVRPGIPGPLERVDEHDAEAGKYRTCRIPDEAPPDQAPALRREDVEDRLAEQQARPGHDE